MLDSSVVDQDVERAESPLDIVEERYKAGMFGHVQSQAQRVIAELSRGSACGIPVEITDGDARATLGEHGRGCQTDTARAAGDGDNCVSQVNLRRHQFIAFLWLLRNSTSTR